MNDSFSRKRLIWFPIPGLALLLAVAALTAPAAPEACIGHELALQILGSGGPEGRAGRASSGYLLWYEERSIALIDAGSGSLLRFGEAGGRIEDLDLVALTHLHIDHSVDLLSFLKAAYFIDRRRPLTLTGPSGNGRFPDLESWPAAAIGPAGSFRYLQDYLDGSDGLFKLERLMLDAASRQPAIVWHNAAITLYAVGVHHGAVPALGYLLAAGGRRIAFSGDESAQNPAFAEMINQADLSVMDYAVPEDVERAGAALHATPGAIGEMAARSGVRHLVLSHLMGRSERVLSASLDLIRRTYTGPVSVAEDLACLPLAAGGASVAGEWSDFGG